MPQHESMHLYRPVQLQDAQEVPDTLIRIKRPVTTQCPTPPDTVTPWLLPGWDDPAKTANYAESRNETDEAGETITVRFDEDEQRSSDFVTWDDQRSGMGHARTKRTPRASFSSCSTTSTQLSKRTENSLSWSLAMVIYLG